MLQFFLWYLLVSALGWLTFPLAFRLFPGLADHGFSLARTFGMLIWGYAFWMMASLGIIQNDGGGLLFGLVVLAAVSGSTLVCRETRKSLGEWIRSRWRLVLTVEILFFVAFVFLAFVRAGNPEIIGTEKPMELAFINAILRSPTFPPHDPWLSGYAISYYYFGYVMTAMLAKITGTLGSVAFNLMLALVFALSAVGAYGVVYNLLAAWKTEHPSHHRPVTSLPLLGPFFLLIVSNFEGFLDVLHNRGLFWKFGPDGSATSAFWKWLDLQDLRDPPSLPLGWMPQRFYWWWRASRVITEYNLAGVWHEIIDEFPFFSYLLGDLHPHVLAMPFDLLAVGVALNLFFGGWKGETNLGFYHMPVRPVALFFGSLVLGGLAFLNTWDILSGFALLVGAYALLRALVYGWTWKRLEDVFALGVPLGLLAILLYLPFYVGFSSQAGGILPNLENPTRSAQLWVMFGPLFLAIFAWLVYLWRAEKRYAKWALGFGLAAALVLFLWIFSWLLGLYAKFTMPDFVTNYLAGEGILNAVLYFSAASLRRLSFIGGLLTLLVLLGTALALLLKSEKSGKNLEKPEKPEKPEEHLSGFIPSSTIFVLFLIIIGSVLVIAPEFVFLRDEFDNRMNTIFKFYYQAWWLLSMASAFGVAIMLQKLRGAWNWVYRTGLAVVLFMALVYPVLGVLTKTNNFQLPAFQDSLANGRKAGDPQALQTAAEVWTLDGGAYFARIEPDDMAAANWLRTAPYGIIVEATKIDASYTEYARISTYSGLPTVLGWPMHEAQWRGTYDPQGTRLDDIRHLYESSNWEQAQSILQQYGIRYVFVGTLERSTYQLNESKFQQHLTPVFTQGQVVVYEVP